VAKNKNSISHKPDSVFCGKPQKAIIYLAATLLLQSCCLPSPTYANTYFKRAAHFPFRSRGICGITAYKVYPSRRLPCGIVSAYLTFSPLPYLRMAVIFCGTFSCFCTLRQAQCDKNSRPLTGVLPCAVRTFLLV
jgi:hypothetical protein